MSKRTWTVRACLGALTGALVIACSPAADAQSTRCEIPRAARDIWRCENGFVIGPENVIIRLPIPETDPDALYNAGIEAAGREDWRVAIAYFTAAHERAHLVPRYMYNLGLAHARAGHEVVAIAWLVAYLTAEPQASNQQVVWEQIARLEQAAQAKIDLLFDGAATAAAQLPTIATYEGDDLGTRASAQNALAAIAAGVDDRRRVLLFVRASNASRLRQRSISDGSELNSSARAAAILNGDIALADYWTAQIGSPPTESCRSWFCEAVILERLRAGHLPQNLCLSFFADRFVFRYLCPSRGLDELETQRDRDIREATRTGDRDRLIALASANSPSRLALTGRIREAYAALPRDGENGFENNLREVSAAFVAEDLMRTGMAAQAGRFVDLAEELVSRVQFADGVTRVPKSSGWVAARARTLLLAEQGQTREALDFVSSYMSSRLDNGLAPNVEWAQNRRDGALVIIDYLIDRGRIEEALQLTSELGSLRQSLVLAQVVTDIDQGRLGHSRDAVSALAQEAALAANGGAPLSSDRRQAVERAIIVATTLGGAAYDLESWLRAEASGRGRVAGYPGSQVTALGEAASMLGGGLRRVRSAHQHSGGTWTQITALNALEQISSQDWNALDLERLAERVVSRAPMTSLEAAATSDARAQLILAYISHRGRGVPEDHERELRLYRLAAEQGNALARVHLGGMYASGQGVTQDYAEAMRLYRLAASQGLARAQYYLGFMYANGQGVPQNLAEAQRLFRLAAAQSDPMAQTHLGVMYSNGQGVTQDYAEALRFYRLASDQNFAHAHALLGVHYANGQGVTRDLAQAQRYYRMAAEQGSSLGQTNLGVMFHNGEGGLVANVTEAIRLWQLAARQGHQSAQQNLRNQGQTW